MEQTIPFERSYWVITGKLLAGEYPAAADREEAYRKLDGLVRAGIKTVVNLTEAHETNLHGIPLFDYGDYLTGFGIEVHRMPIKDVSVPSTNEMYTILDLIEKSINDDKPVYFHCWGGVGRTGTVLGCFLIHNKLATRENVFDVIDHLKRNTSISHRSSPETREQRDFVVNYRR
ncbi:dual specificity phosphatase, catalytic domain [Bacteroidales bacterium 6E]|nr:dual specificity phosphatase, catalytic domain [Bacteroidales bacterium 6E]